MLKRACNNILFGNVCLIIQHFFKNLHSHYDVLLKDLNPGHGKNVLPAFIFFNVFFIVCFVLVVLVLVNSFSSLVSIM